MTSLTISLMSYRPPSLRVIGSNEIFEAFVLFCAPTYSRGHIIFSWVDVVCRSVPPCSVSISGSGKGDFYPSCSSSTVFYCSSANFTASHVAWALAVASSFLCFSASYAIRSFISSFVHCAADFFTSTTKPTGACHSGSQDLRTVKMKFAVTKYGNSCHVFVGSFRAPMKTWWKSTLNSAKLC